MKQEQFEAHASVEHRHWWFTARRKILQDIVSAVAPPPGALMDVGCGTGGNAGAFARSGYDVLGLDPAAAAIELARSAHSDAAFISTDDIESGREFLRGGGTILLTDVLEHVPDDRDLFQRALEVLPSGGHLVVTVPADPRLWSAHDEVFGHYRRYELSTLSRVWAELPVAVRVLSYYNSRLYPAIRLHRAVRGRTASAGGDLDVPTGPINRLLHRIFASEAKSLVRSLDKGYPVFDRGVSLIAVLRRA